MPESVLPDLEHPTLAPAAAPARIVVLLGHPDLRHSRVNRAMLAAVGGLAPDAGVQVRDVYALYPDYSIDVALEQSMLARARLVVVQHPMYWYAMPALLKLYVDEVFTEGWAYGEGGRALAGKDLWLAASASGSPGTDPAHPHVRFERCLPPYRQTAQQCGMRFLTPFVLHVDAATGVEDIDAHARRYAELLRTYPAWVDAPAPPAATAA